MVTYREISPVDVLYLRGNRLFGGAGAHGEAQMPPWPSTFSGAMASLAMAQNGLPQVNEPGNEAYEAFSNRLKHLLGDDYALTFLGLVSNGRWLATCPADLMVQKENGGIMTVQLRPVPITGMLERTAAGWRLPMLPVLPVEKRVKPARGYWLDGEGWSNYLAGKPVGEKNLVHKDDLWKLDPRLGIAIDREVGTAREHHIYTTDTVALLPGTSFLCGFRGNQIPDSGLLRLGGDGRGAEVKPSENNPGKLGKPESGWKRFKMILMTPGIFPDGWLPPGMSESEEGLVFRCGSLKARLVCAAVNRGQTVSGWDLARWCPKPARKAVPAGSVYWFEVEEGGGDTKELEALWENSLYELCTGEQDWIAIRKREGFSRVWFGTW